MKTFKARIPEVNSWLLAGAFFFIPISVAPAYILSVIMLVLCLLEGRIPQKLEMLRREPLVWIFAAYFFVFVLSLLWTEDLAWGMRMVRRQTFFLLFALYFLVASREHLPRYLLAFLVSISICEVFSYYNFMQMHVWPQLPEGLRVNKGWDPAPFVDHILFSPALALAGYLSAHQLLFARQSTVARLGYAAVMVATAGNLIFSGGRSGILGFLVLILLLAVQRFARRPFVAIAGGALLFCAFISVAYYSNDYFRLRVDGGVSDIQNFEKDPNTSLGQRITFLANAWRVYATSPVLGVGVGDYPKEYEKMNRIHTPEVDLAWNPHNQYMYALTAGGIPAGFLLLLVLFYPFFRKNVPDGREHMRRAVPLLLITICLVESYLLRSNTSLMYVLFLAALWCGSGKVKT